MSTVVLLSSSPPRVFARSPTPADSSSPLPSTAAILQDRSPGTRRFKTRADRHEGLSPAFCTARQVLAKKNGAENAIIPPLGRNKFRSSQDDSVEDAVEITDVMKKSKPKAPTPTNTTKSNEISQSELRMRLENKQENTTTSDISSTNAIEDQSALPDLLLLERASARKLDWTPPSTKSRSQGEEKPVAYSAGFLNGVLNNYTFLDPTSVESVPQVQVSNPAKRRRVEPLGRAIEAKIVKSAPTFASAGCEPTKAVSKTNRSPVKKTLTITGLATSNYLGQDDTEESPIMQYLVSTQAQLNDVSAGVGLQTKVQKTKGAAQKLKGSKQKHKSSLLLSPQSAIRTYEVQETIFGSASQLERDESPEFLREVIEATKQSESFVGSDPISPQRTQPFSVDNTPRVGTARFRRTRNLWAAAGRDEDNALLHVDTVDLTDTPAVRAAFAGKDVMLQANARKMQASKLASPSLRGGYSPLAPNYASEVIDIGDISTPCVNATRNFTSTTLRDSPRKSPIRARGDKAKNIPLPEEPAITMPKEQPPAKPNYEGFSIHDLNKQIKSYGFKAMRKREKMIELLDRCWEEKHGSSETSTNKEPEVAPYGDFLSKVHDISARPEPKVKKTPVRRKKNEIGTGTSEKPVKKPRQRKKKEPVENNDVTTIKQGQPRKRTSKSASRRKESIVDIDGIWDKIPEELRSLEAFDDWAKPERTPKLKLTTEPSHDVPLLVVEEPQRPATPPATLPEKELPPSIPTIEELPASPQINPQPTEFLSTPAPTPSLVPIFSQITAAIMHQSKTPHPGRNHNTHPTWHEKILLYDPIILEDLAAWLNTEGLGAIGEDREVSALEVREWCETRGICCLWRGGWRGNKLAQQ